MRVGCWFVRRSDGARWGSVFFLEVDDGRGEGPLLRKDGEAQRCHHEDDGNHDGEFAKKVRRPTAAEHRLAGTAERRADFGAFARLQQNGTDHEEAGDEVNDDDECVHEFDQCTGLFLAARTIVANDSVFRQAPPTSAPSMSGSLKRDSAFCGVTLPPYKILIRSAACVVQPAAMLARIARCTATACSVVAAWPVPMAHTGS